MNIKYVHDAAATIGAGEGHSVLLGFTVHACPRPYAIRQQPAPTAALNKFSAVAQSSAMANNHMRPTSLENYRPHDMPQARANNHAQDEDVARLCAANMHTMININMRCAHDWTMHL